MSRIFLSVILFFASMNASLSFNTVALKYKQPLTRMSMSESYLNNLKKLPLKHDINHFNNLVKNATIYPEQDAQVDTMYVNINKVNSLFFSPKSRNIMFMLENELADIFYYDNDNMYKLTDKTKIKSSTMRNFVITELSPLTDCIICK